METKVIHSTKYNETAAGLITKLLEAAQIASADAERQISTDEICITGAYDFGAGSGFVLLRRQTLTDKSTVYDVVIS